MKTPTLIRLTHPSGISLVLMDMGATWLSCEIGAPLLAEPREILLGCKTPADYQQQKAYLGATIGRYANRIGGARFPSYEGAVVLSPNEGKNILHGGAHGFHTKYWQIEEKSETHVVFSLVSEAGEGGFPGNLQAKVTYRLIEQGILCAYEATSDAATPVCLTNHAYFNLDGANKLTDARARASRRLLYAYPNRANKLTDARARALEIAADFYLPVDKEGIPEGHLQSVSGSSFDFRTRKTIAQNFLSEKNQKNMGGYDHAFLLRKECENMDEPAAILAAADESLVMRLFTDQSALQFYSGNHLKGALAREGVYSAYQGIALETECLPDSPNHPEWPQKSCYLLGNETYRTSTKLCFEGSF